jgi:hypothetical protein
MVFVAAAYLRAQQPSPPPLPPASTQAPAPATTPPPPVELPPPPTDRPAAPPAPQPTIAFPAPRRVQFTVDPKTPLKDLLPKPPKAAPRKPSLPGDDLNSVPEVSLMESLPADMPGDKAFQEIGAQIVKINHVNKEKPDHFMTLLLGERSDLRGLPFLLGDDCRTSTERHQKFSHSVQAVRESARGVLSPIKLSEEQVENVWATFRACCDRAERGQAAVESTTDHTSPARVGAIMQMMAPASAKMRLGMVKHLSSVSHPEATRALARLALYSPEDEVRRAAVAALQTRRERDYTEIIMAGFNYPMPAVSRRAAEAVVQLDRKDLVGRLVDILDEPDSRAPISKTIKGKQVSVVRELVRINHHHNCLLCHPPANGASTTGNVTVISGPVAVTEPQQNVTNIVVNQPSVLTGAVPIPGEPLPTPGEGYQGASPDVLVRIDATYLRQDFSLLQPVKNAQAWPALQRFDFLVRTRELGEEEAAEYQRLLKREPGVLPPNHRAALLALRELTGKDTAPTAKAWRELLGQGER